MELTEAQAKYYEQFPEEAEALGYSPEDIQNALNGTSPTTPETPQSSSMDDYFLAFPEEKETFLGGNAEDWRSESDRFSEDARNNVRESAVAEADSLSKQDLYGKPPRVGPITRATAAFQDVANLWTGYNELSEAQLALQDLPEAKKQWEKESQELYNQTGVLQDNGDRVYTAYEPDPDDPSKLVATDYLIPTYDSNFWSRIFKEGSKSLAKDAVGIYNKEFTTDTSEYDPSVPEEERGFAANTPSMQLSGGEQFMSDLWTLALPMGVVAKPAQAALRLPKAVLSGNKATKLGGFGTVTANTISGSILETLAVSEGNSGLVISSDRIKGIAESAGADITDETANDLAVLADGLILNGAMDGLLTVAAPLFNFITRTGKYSTGATIRDIDGMSAAVQDGIILKVAEFLDPTMMKGKNALEVGRNLKVLSKVLNSNAVVTLKIADFQKDIPVPTAQALMTGSEAYMRETRQHLQDTMGADEFEEMIQQASGDMYQRMISIMRSNRSNPDVAGTDNAVLNQMGDFFSEFANSRVAGDIDEAADATVGNLSRQIEVEKNALGADINEAEAARDAIKTNIDNVVADDQSIDLLMDDFTQMQLTGDDRQALSNWTQSTAYPVFEAQKDGVEAAFRAIPNTPIGPAAAEALVDQVLDAVQNVNVFDSSGNQARDALGKIYTALTNKKMVTEDTRTFLYGPDGVFTMQTSGEIFIRPEKKAEFLERIGSTIGFQDVYNLRPTLSGMYDTYSATNPKLAQKFSQIKKHISSKVQDDGNLGQLGYAQGETRELAEIADQKYKDFDNRWRNDDRIKALTSVLSDQRSKRNLDPSQVTSRDQGVVDSNRAMESYVNTAMDEADGSGFTQLYEAIDESMGNVGPTTPLMGDLIMARMMEKLSVLATKGMSEIDLNQQIAPAIKQLRAAGNDQSADRLAQMVVDIGQRRRDLGDDLLGAEESITQAKQALKAAESSVLNDLLSKVTRRTGGVGKAARTDTRAALSDIITKPDSNGTIELMAEIDKLPTSQRLLAQQALQSVALDTVGSKVFGSSITGFKPDGTPLRNIQPSQIVKLTADSAKGLMKSLDIIFPEGAADAATESVRVGVFNALNVLYANAGPTLLRDVPVGSNTEILTRIGEETRDAVSTSILVLAGYMNPTAAMLRRLSSARVEEIIALEKEIHKQVLATIITSPKEFANLVDITRKRQSRDAIRDASLAALRVARLDGRYQIRIREEEDGQQDYSNPVLNSLAIAVGEDMTEAALGVMPNFETRKNFPK
jgi:hypothetical protein